LQSCTTKRGNKGLKSCPLALDGDQLRKTGSLAPVFDHFFSNIVSNHVSFLNTVIAEIGTWAHGEYLSLSADIVLSSPFAFTTATGAEQVSKYIILLF